MVIIKRITHTSRHRSRAKSSFMSTMSVVLSLLMMVSISIAGIPTISALKCSYFTHQETIYIDLTEFTGWENDGAVIRVYTYYGNSDDNWNVENNKDDSACNTSECYQNAIVPSSVVDHVYSFNISGNEVGYVKVLRMNPDLSTAWNNTGFVYNKDRSGSANCIKITGWDNSYQWTTYSPTDGTDYYEVTASPDSTITGNSNLYTIDATFYDYYTDGEIQRGWGNINYEESHGYWEPYIKLNNKIASASNGVPYPMYFGNFFDKNDGYTGEGSSNMVNFFNQVNNSARLGDTHKSVVGLTGPNLVNGELYYAANGGGNGTKKVPFFDKSFLQSNKVGSVVNTKFPMRKVVDNGITTYKFNSEGSTAKSAGDSVWFNTARDTISYGYGNNNGSKDALYYYSNPKAASGYGFFPFDSTRGADKEAYDFGFGMRVDVKFNLGADDSSHIGQIKGANGSYSNQVFNFTGDDDVWVYVDGKLILDLGGDHQKAQGSIDFHNRSVTVNTGSNTLNSATRNTSFTLDNYGDPTAEHTLTMFYVERGMVESNLSFDFNFAPIGNELIVDKTVNTTNINTGLQTAVAAADTFSFNQPTANGKVSSQGTISNSTYTLKNAQSIRFKDQFTVPTSMAVTESESSPLNYTTSWKAVDLVLKGKGSYESDYTIAQSSGDSKTASFTYQTKDTESEFAMTRVQLSYVNTPTVGNVAVTKTVADGTGDDLTREFDGTVTVSLDGGNTYAAYPLTYTSSDDPTQTSYTLSSSGALVSGAKLKHGRTLTFSSLPSGAIVKIEESFDSATAQLYTFTSAEGTGVTQSGNGGYYTVAADSTKTMTITNTPVPPESATQIISVKKTLDGQNYSGSLFKFCLEGLNIPNDPAANAKDTTGIEIRPITVSNGTGTFDTLTFDSEGVYRYFVYEDTSYLAQVDSSLGTTYADDISQTSSNFVATITVTRSGITLTASNPVFTRTNKTSAADITAADLSGQSLTTATFTNVVKKGSVQIVKNNQAGEKVQNVTFALFKLTESDAEAIETYSDSDKYDYIVSNGTYVSSQETNSDGIASFTNLTIYESNYTSSGQPSYQNYALVETATNNKYNLNKTPMVFTIPQKNNSNELVYDLEFGYINGKMVNPYTGYFSPLALIRNIGFGIIGVALVLGAVYLLRRKKVFAKYKKKH